MQHARHAEPQSELVKADSIYILHRGQILKEFIADCLYMLECARVRVCVCQCVCEIDCIKDVSHAASLELLTGDSISSTKAFPCLLRLCHPTFVSTNLHCRM